MINILNLLSQQIIFLKRHYDRKQIYYFILSIVKNKEDKNNTLKSIKFKKLKLTTVSIQMKDIILKDFAKVVT